MKKKLIVLLFVPTLLFSQQTKTKFMSIEPHIGFLFTQLKDSTLLQNTTTARGFSINPHLSIFINPQLEIGLQPTFTILQSQFAALESGKGYALGYFLRYYPQKLVFQQHAVVREKKYFFFCHPHLFFKHDISTIYTDEQNEFRFSNRLQTQNFFLSAGINTYFWRQFYFNFSAGINYTPALTDKPFYFLTNYSFGYTFQKHHKSK